jgi:rubredoxin
MIFNDAHRCLKCGYRFGDHAGADNPDCPEGRCPGTRFPVFFTNYGKDLEDAVLAPQLAAYWNERSTVFTPK